MELERELQTYEGERPALLAHAGKFVLIRGDEVAGVFDVYADALQAGHERFGLAGFMVHEIPAADEPDDILTPFFEDDEDPACRN